MSPRWTSNTRPANHLSFRLADIVLVPQAFPESMRRFGAAASRVRRYPGVKEDVYLADLNPTRYSRLHSVCQPTG